MSKQPQKPLRIFRMTVINFKRIEMLELELDPNGNLVIVAGENGSGKSSALDAIVAGMVGPRAYPAMPIRAGQQKSQIVLDLGDVIIERTITHAKEQPALKVKSRDGMLYPNGQKLVDAWLGQISFDPIEFVTKLKPKEQVTMLLEAVPLAFDPAQLDAEKAELDETFADWGREVKRLQGALDSMDEPAVGQDAKEDSVTGLTEEFNRMAGQNRARQDAIAQAERLNRAYQDAINSVTSIEQQIEQLKLKLKQAKQVEDAAYKAAEAAKAAALAMPEHDLTELAGRIQGAEEHNETVRAAQQYYRTRGELNDAQARRDEYDAKRQDWHTNRAALLKAAKMPVPGLSFSVERGKERLFLDDIPLEQCCSSAQLKLAVALAMALNPLLRVILIHDGSLLDAASLQALAELANDRGYQVWIEQVREVGDDEGVSVIIQDGRAAPRLPELVEPVGVK